MIRRLRALAGDIRRRLAGTHPSRTRRPSAPDRRRVRLAARRFTRTHRAGSATSPFAGAGMEMFGVRGWAQGDDLRDVDWRVTARKDDLHVRVRHADRELPVLLVVDRSPELDPVRHGWYGATIAAAAEWFARVAAAGGMPVGLCTVEPSPAWLPPARGREALQAVLARLDAREGAVGSGRRDPVVSRPGDGMAAALERTATGYPGEALVVAIGPWDLGPEEVLRASKAVNRLARRHRLVPVWVDGEGPLVRQGVLPADLPSGRRILVDTARAEVRARHEASLSAWRAAVAGVLAPAGRPPIRIRAGDDVSGVLARAFRRPGPERPPRPGGRSRAPASSGVGSAAVALLLALSPGAGHAAAPVVPQVHGGPGIVADTLLSPPVLGSPVERRIRIRTAPGVEPRPGGPRSGEVWDVVAESLHSLSGDTLWELHQRLIPWWMGRQTLPGVRLSTGAELIAGPGAPVAAPSPPEDASLQAGGGPGPTWPDLAAGAHAAFWRWAGRLPVLLALLGIGLWALPRIPVRPVRTGPRSRRPSRPPVHLEDLPPREALDRVMDELRGWARDRGGAAPGGWTPAGWSRWSRRTLEEEAARAVATVVEAADEVRFDPRGSLPGAVGRAVPALRSLADAGGSAVPRDPETP